eukprot:PLAT15898.1.p1 GENE.PLAT15898.1~~PLAT15898.1.p1  ORF type:complete len:683 (+),score=215.47 PLAT15898.1:189-2051(+)
MVLRLGTLPMLFRQVDAPTACVSSTDPAIVFCGRDGQIESVNVETKAATNVLHRFDGLPLIGPSDLAVRRSDGLLFVADGLRDSAFSSRPFGAVLAVNTANNTVTQLLRLDGACSLALSANERHLFVVDDVAGAVRRYAITVDTATGLPALSGGDTVVSVEGASWVRVDALNQLYVVSEQSVTVWAADGQQLLQQLSCGSSAAANVTGSCRSLSFGGVRGDQLLLMTTEHGFLLRSDTRGAELPWLPAERDARALLPQRWPTRVKSGLRFGEGAAWDPAGRWVFSDTIADELWRMVPGQQPQLWRRPTGHPLGSVFDERGNAYVAMLGESDDRPGAIVRISPLGETFVIADAYGSARFNAPNDLALRSDGVIFFTDPLFFTRPDSTGVAAVYSIAVNGTVTQLLTAAQLGSQADGIALSLDESVLYLSSYNENLLYAYDVSADGTELSGKRLVGNNSWPLSDEGASDGFKLDEYGRIFSTGPDGLWIWANGTLLGRLLCPQPAQHYTSVAFGGSEEQLQLLLTTASSVYAMDIDLRGAHVPYSIVNPPQPPPQPPTTSKSGGGVDAAAIVPVGLVMLVAVIAAVVLAAACVFMHRNVRMTKEAELAHLIGAGPAAAADKA